MLRDSTYRYCYIHKHLQELDENHSISADATRDSGVFGWRGLFITVRFMANFSPSTSNSLKYLQWVL